MGSVGYEQLYYEELMSFFSTYSIMVSIIGIVTIVAWWKIFEKAGHESWKAIIPVYNMYTMFEVAYGKGKGWKFLLLLIPCVGPIFYIMMLLKLAKAFGKETGFGLGLVFLNTIFILILGFGSAEYVGAEEK